LTFHKHFVEKSASFNQPLVFCRGLTALMKKHEAWRRTRSYAAKNSLGGQTSSKFVALRSSLTPWMTKIM